MMPDYLLEATLDFKFTTRAFATGIPTVLAGTPVVEIYEDNSVTQITAAETLTVDFDSVVGLNNLRVVATAANGFEAGKSYAAILSAGTVGGVSVVGEVVAQFSIQRSPAFARLGAPVGASISEDIADVPTVAEFNARTILAADYFDPATDTVALVTDLSTKTGFSLSTAGILAVWHQALSAIVTAGSIGKLLKDEITAARMSELDDVAGKLVAVVDLIKTAVDAIPTTAMRGTDSAVLAATVGVAGVGLTDLGAMSTAMKAEINAEVLDVLNTDTFAEPAGVPAATATIVAMLHWIFTLLRNKGTQTSTLKTLRNDGDAADIASAVISSDGTTFTRQEYT